MMNKKIPFNKPYLAGKELDYIYQAIKSGKISGNGSFTQKCQVFFEESYGFKKTLLTTSCTDALEMAAIIADIKPDDEVIIPSYTFVSSALAFIRQGARVVFVDSRPDHPGIDEREIEGLISTKTRAIVPVHYAGVACDMDKIMELADKYNLLVIEDAAQAIHSFYKGKPLGSIGHLAAFSFHETKNIISGEGGLLAINDDRFIKRAEIIWEKGTNRAEFFRGEVNKYNWVDIGSSFLPSDILAAFLWAQLENLESIQKRRIEIWESYYKGLSGWALQNNIRLPFIPDYASNNGHLFYIVCNDEAQKEKIINGLQKENIFAVSHYLSLHKSPYYSIYEGNKRLINSVNYETKLLRLPMYYELQNSEIEYIIETIKSI